MAAKKATIKSKTAERFRISRHADKIQDELESRRHIGADQTLSGMVAALNIEGSEACIKLDAITSKENDVIKFCKKQLVKKTVALVTAKGKNWHAEQKILYMLVRAKTLGGLSVTFGGTFRPCRGCFETLNVVKNYYMPNLRFGAHPGHFWCTTTDAHAGILRLLWEQKKITEKILASDFNKSMLLNPVSDETNRPQLRTNRNNNNNNRYALHFVSDSDSD